MIRNRLMSLRRDRYTGEQMLGFLIGKVRNMPVHPVRAARASDDVDGRAAIYEELPARYERQDWVVLALIFGVVVVAAVLQHVPFSLFLFGD